MHETTFDNSCSLSSSPAGAGRRTPAQAERLSVTWDAALEAAWKDWLNPQRFSFQRDYALLSDTVAAHVDALFAASVHNVARMAAAAGMEAPRAVLDFGCSVGFNALAAQWLFPDAVVEGMDPEAISISLGQMMAARLDPRTYSKAPRLSVAVGEALPYADGTFDFIYSTTVIEHVDDVDACLSEMARVLRPGGMIYLDAPNYVFPFEPHVGAVMPPLCPKGLLKALMTIQGKAADRDFVDHLQWVHPRWVERRFRELGLTFDNLAAAKVRAAFAGGSTATTHYKGAARALQALGRVGLGRPLAGLMIGLMLYPSLIYVARKPARDG